MLIKCYIFEKRSGDILFPKKSGKYDSNAENLKKRPKTPNLGHFGPIFPNFEPGFLFENRAKSFNPIYLDLALQFHVAIRICIHGRADHSKNRTRRILNIFRTTSFSFYLFFWMANMDHTLRRCIMSSRRCSCVRVVVVVVVVVVAVEVVVVSPLNPHLCNVTPRLRWLLLQSCIILARCTHARPIEK